MDANQLFALLGSASLAGVLGAVVNAVVNRRKLGAEATVIITQAAGGIIGTLQDDNARLRADNDQLRARVDQLERAVRGAGIELPIPLVWPGIPRPRSRN